VAAEIDQDLEQSQEILRTAAEHASTAVPVAALSDTAADVLDAMRGRVFDSASVVAVCDGERLIGLLTIERLLAAPPAAVLADIADLDPPVVAPHADQELVAWTAVEHGEPGLAVVDGAGRFRGLIPPQRLLAVLLAEHDEDMARLGGFLHSAAAARSVSRESVGRRLWHRLPWLAIGLAGAMVAAGVVGAFEADLQREVLLAFFVPGVVYMADAVGTQTETLVIRGLSVGVGIGGVVVRELVTGLLVGLLLAAAVLPVTLLVWGNAQVAVTVSLALLGACSVATLVAMALPWAFHKLGRDPAFGSGPLATVLQDLLSIVIYLGIARAIVG